MPIKLQLNKLNLKVITYFSINDKYGPSFQVDPDPNECLITNFDKFIECFLEFVWCKVGDTSGILFI